MTLPTATYRLQFRNGMDFERARGLVPYLARLGVSHLYASPLFTATPGSTHGYDVTDPTRIDPDLGGIDGLRALSRTLADHGMGLIVDIVPNHMAFTLDAPWLCDVLRHGAASRYARHFDIALEDARLRLPWLEQSFEATLAAGEVSVGDGDDGPVLQAGSLAVPLADTGQLDRARTGDRDTLRRLHDAQPWRLTAWRTEGDAITHRRFFNVTSLIGVRVEDDAVFDDVHRLLFQLVDDDIVHGIRIDHIDGLLDPAAYLDRLRDQVGDTPVWIEKILTGSEALPADWPVEGTTGYVAARAFARLLTDGDGLAAVDAAYRGVTDRTEGIDDALWQARVQIMTDDLAAELWALHAMLSDLASDDPEGAEFGPETLREAIIAYIAAFPRYRTYTTAAMVSDDDAQVIETTAAGAASRLNAPGAVPFLARMLLRTDPASAQLRLRMQQVTGAAVAKSQEDTAFYREVRLLSGNEVGSEPEEDALSVSGFHRAMRTRARAMPHGLSLTSSHDTKRSEDARMRIAAITRAPEAFAAWFRICAGFAPVGLNANLVWYVAQTFLALDPEDGDIADRLADHVVKALREAKSESFWTAPNTDLETQAQDYVRRLVAHFPVHAPEIAPILSVADNLSLVQTGLKLCVPGIPDIYQGCERADYSLTDPDNRRAVAFDLLASSLDDPGVLPRKLDREKFALTRTLLGLRRDGPGLFADGSYDPIEAGDGFCAFGRNLGGTGIVVCADITGGAGAAGRAGPGALIWPISERATPLEIRRSECPSSYETGHRSGLNFGGSGSVA